MSNPLNAFTTATVAGGFKLPALPKLNDLVNEHGFKDGMKAYDERMAQWGEQLVRQVNERLQKRDEPAASKLTAT